MTDHPSPLTPWSPLPWKQDTTSPRFVLDARGLNVAGTVSHSPANAAYIVHACNLHHELLAALKAALPWAAIATAGDAAFGIENPQRTKNHAEDMALILAVLQKAEQSHD